MKVLFVASEAAPFIKTGGLADVMGALPKALQGLGVEKWQLHSIRPKLRPKPRGKTLAGLNL